MRPSDRNPSVKQAVGDLHPSERPASDAPSRDRGPDLSWHQIGFLAEAVAVASRALLAAATEIREKYALGRRGPWIIGLIATDRLFTQSDIGKRYKCGRSTMCEEVDALVAAGLITTRKSEQDARQIVLSLTPLGEAANRRLGEAMTSLLKERLAGYSQYDVLFCARLLADIGAAASLASMERR
jgi:DNA-binding MarR family transcriptional regulator